jgi:hypothetical protein
MASTARSTSPQTGHRVLIVVMPRLSVREAATPQSERPERG